MTRHLAIGDTHGCFNALTTLIDFVQPREDDILITLGDYVDRGPRVDAVIDWLIHQDKTTQRLVPLRGNHDIMMMNARDSDAALDSWLHMGGDATLRSYASFEGDAGSVADVPEHHWFFLRHRLRPYFESKTHFFVHANADPGMHLSEQPEYTLYWEKLADPARHISGKVMVCGHTSQRSGLPWVNDHAICIDTRAFDGGWLTCLHAESGKLWQANEQGKTRTLWVDELRGR